MNAQQPERPGPRDAAPGVRIEAQAHDESHQYIAGRDVIVHHAPLRPVHEVAAPPGLRNVPSHTRLFVGRDDELTQLAERLAGEGAVVVAAVHGLGGIGKSTLAARYAAEQARDRMRDPVWWITADTPPSLQAGLAGLATALQPELAAGLPLEALAERAVGWLATHTGWLLVLDNVTDPDHVTPLLDRLSTGQVLVTSRLGEGWHRLGARTVRLDVLSEAEAIDLLTSTATPDGDRSATGRLDDGVEDGVELVRELGCLPLAIEQAAAYLHQNRLAPADYLALLNEQPEVLYDQAAEAADAKRTIARIWRVTLDQLVRVPWSADLLRILAWYAPEAIPRAVLTGLTSDTNPQKPGITNAELHQALGALAAYNMINLGPETVTVHRLVQALARTPDPRGDGDPHRQAADIGTARSLATYLLDRARPAQILTPADWPTWRALLPHIAALADHADPATDTATTCVLLDQTAAFLENQGDLVRAIAYLERALTAGQQLYANDHPTPMTMRNNLALAYESAGDLGRAIPLYERTLADRERVLGADHPNTLTTRNNLASAFHTAGDLGRAIPLHERTLADRERVLGADHPSALISRNNLAYAYRAAGDLDRAIPLQERTLADRERVLGPDHPNTLTSRNNLAAAYRAAGNLGRAIPLQERTLTDCERVLGADHPSTLISRNNLAHAYRAAGNLGRAILLYERILTDRERILGPDHPDTLSSRNTLASACQTAGDLGRAIPLYEGTLTDCERVLGPDHPITKAVRANLGTARQ